MNVSTPVSVSAKRSPLASPAFFLVAALTLVLGNAADLLGTYIAQPHFENEANPVHRILRAHGIELGWPGAIVGKLLYCTLSLWLLHVFLKRRRAFYPPPGANGRVFWTTFFYGRVLTWAQTLYSWPRDLRPFFYLLGPLASLCGPYFGYLGYENLAVIHNWWSAPGFWLGGFWIDTTIFAWICVIVPGLGRLIWLDTRSHE